MYTRSDKEHQLRFICTTFFMKMCILATTCGIRVITLEVCLLTLRAYPNNTSGLSSHSRAGRCKIAPLDDTSIIFCTELEYVPIKFFGYRDISKCPWYV